MRSPLNGPGTARSAASAGDGLPTPLLAHTAPGAACISSSQPLLPECCDEPFNSNPNTDG